MKRLLTILLTAAACFPGLTAVAEESEPIRKVVQTGESKNYSAEMMKPLTPTYDDGVMVGNPWDNNWFINVAGGGGAFIGAPLGCDDLMGRTRPYLGVAIGKWFTPSIAGRIKYQGMKFEDYVGNTHPYQYINADFLWNVVGWMYNSRQQPIIHISPFAGCGVMRNVDERQKLFAFDFGLQGEWNFSSRAAVTVEISNVVTLQEFDGYGKKGHFGDNLLAASIGLNIRLGKVGWNRVVKAAPFVKQNDWLVNKVNSLTESNNEYATQHDKDSRTIAELQKILEIEGLLGKYKGRLDTDGSSLDRGYPKNDYSGLNSLRARIKNKDSMSTRDGDPFAKTEGEGDNLQDIEQALEEGREMQEDMARMEGFSRRERGTNEYAAMMEEGEECIGSPIYFFFRVGTSQLTDNSQLVNLDAIVKVVKAYGLKVTVIGAADSATGSQTTNTNLSKSRMGYVAKALISRGVDESKITQESEGGIADYKPNKANRHTRVLLHF